MKKINERGFSHIELIIIVFILAMITGIGVYVWRGSNNSDAGASGFKVVAKGGGVTAYACRGETPQRGGIKVKATKSNISGVTSQRAILSMVVGVKYGYPASSATSTSPVVPWGVGYQLRDEQGNFGPNPLVKFYIQYKKDGRINNTGSASTNFQKLQPC